jgi:hypothetical protein
MYKLAPLSAWVSGERHACHHNSKRGMRVVDNKISMVTYLEQHNANFSTLDKKAQIHCVFLKFQNDNKKLIFLGKDCKRE